VTTPLAIIIYLVVLAILAMITLWLVRRDREEAQLELEQPKYAVQTLPVPVEDTAPDGFSNRLDHRFRRLMYQSGLDISAEAGALLMIMVGLLIGGGLFVWQDSLPQGIVGFVIGMFIPLGYFLWARSVRTKAMREQLPDVMDLMARSVRAGESIDQAIGQVGTSFTPPLGVEFQRTHKQLEMGLSMPAAMKALTARTPLPEMRILASTFNVQRRSGGNVATNLDRLSHVIRDRLSYQRQFMAATGASRASTILIGLIGPVVFLYMIVSQPDYMGQFFLSSGGIALLSTAVVLQVVGLLWIFGLLRNDY
jgi:tight adherence protein B